MRKLIKILLAIVAAIVILMSLCVLLLVTLVNPNKYKAQIAQGLAKELNQQKVTLVGDIHWTFSKGVGIKIDQIVVSNPIGFAPVPFLQINNAQISFKFFPLLYQHIKLAHVDIQHMVLNLITDQKGQHNWTMFLPSATPNNTTAPHKAEKPITSTQLEAFDLGTINIADGELVWQNLKTSRNTTLSHVRLSTTHVQTGRTFLANLAFTYKPNPSSLSQIMVDLNTTAFMNPAKKYYALQRLSAQIDNKQNPNRSDLFSLTANAIQFNGISHQLKIIASQLRNDYLHTMMTLSFAGFPEQLQGQGYIHLWGIPKKILPWWGYKVVTPSLKKNDQLLSVFSLTAEIQTDEQTARLNSMRGRLDRSNYQGHVTIKNIEKLRSKINFNLHVDKINWDEYLGLHLAPLEQLNVVGDHTVEQTVKRHDPINVSMISSAVAAPVSIAENAVDHSSQNRMINSSTSKIMTDNPASKSQVNGVLKIDKLTMNQIHLTQFNTTVTLNNKKISLSPLTANIDGGQITGDLSVDYNNTALPKWDIQANLMAVNLALLLAEKQMTGVANVNTHLMMSGRTSQEKLQTLHGNFNLSVKDGVLKKINLSKIIEQGLNFLRSHNTTKEIPAGDSTFSKLTTLGTIDHGIIIAHQIMIEAPIWVATGEGTLNLTNQNIHFNLGVTPKDPGHFIKIKNISLPVLVIGTLNNPKLKPDFSKINDSMPKNDIKENVQKIIDKQQNPKLRDKLEKGLQKYLN